MRAIPVLFLTLFCLKFWDAFLQCNSGFLGRYRWSPALVILSSPYPIGDGEKNPIPTGNGEGEPKKGERVANPVDLRPAAVAAPAKSGQHGAKEGAVEESAMGEGAVELRPYLETRPLMELVRARDVGSRRSARRRVWIAQAASDVPGQPGSLEFMYQVGHPTFQGNVGQSGVPVSGILTS